MRVKYVVEDDQNGFYCITCDEYDDKINFRHASDKNFNVQFKKKIVPGNLVIFDVLVFSEQIGDSDEYERTIIISNMNQDEYIYEEAY